jgi:predicted CopG family antitoxin
MLSMNERATIMVKNQTRELMKKIGRKEQTYDDLILELIQFKQKEIQI